MAMSKTGADNDVRETAPDSLRILIVEDHQLMLKGTVDLIQEHFPSAEISSAQTAQDALDYIQNHDVDVAIVDLSLPKTAGTVAHIEHGLNLLDTLMSDYPLLNLVIQSSTIKVLVRLISEIERHRGGFTIADKGVPIKTFLTRIEWSLERLSYTKDLQTDLEFKPEWLEVLHLAYEEGLQDKAIAQTMYKSERMIRHYWSKIQDRLGIYPEKGKNVRILTQIRAREAGLLD